MTFLSALSALFALAALVAWSLVLVFWTWFSGFVSGLIFLSLDPNRDPISERVLQAALWPLTGALLVILLPLDSTWAFDLGPFGLGAVRDTYMLASVRTQENVHAVGITVRSFQGGRVRQWGPFFRATYPVAKPEAES